MDVSAEGPPRGCPALAATSRLPRQGAEGVAPPEVTRTVREPPPLGAGERPESPSRPGRALPQGAGRALLPVPPSDRRPGAKPPHIPYERAQGAEEDHSSHRDPEGRCSGAVPANGTAEQQDAGKGTEDRNRSADAACCMDIINGNLSQRNRSERNSPGAPFGRRPGSVGAAQRLRGQPLRLHAAVIGAGPCILGRVSGTRWARWSPRQRNIPPGVLVLGWV
ncbi:hypothetical protein GCM10023329_24500 [Streptomyces sanyensis]|uniref:Uncharacterized protein n=1 Tax=Streptomyces sanyensis TaxID=568869 RepID=A0ABP9A6B1_9ACTN